MTAAPPRRAPERASGPRAWEVATFAVALGVAGLVTVALASSGTETYVDVATASGRTSARLTVRSGAAAGGAVADLPALADLHTRWTAYVTGRIEDPPRTLDRELFTPDEYAHMADVRTVFITAQACAVVAMAILVWLAWRARREGRLARLARAGALTALVGVGATGVLAATAFDAAFLLFHRIFFPQGNFLFSADSSLLAIYPASYFYAVTLRIGLSFVALAGLCAVVSHVALLRRSAST